MELKEILNRIQDDLKNNRIKVEVREGVRVYTDGINSVPMTTPQETAELYYKTFIQPKTKSKTNFDDLPRCTIYVGQPDTGKTYQAQKLAEEYGVQSLLIMARDNLNLETLLEDFTLVDGKPVFKESLAIKMLSGTENGIIIIDEFNTLLTGVMKTLQPLLDNTSKTFEYKGKVYNKNLNCKFILTLNDKDKGISVIPDAILSRSYLKYFETPSLDILATWSGQTKEYVEHIFNLYKTFKLLSVFGTRQINIISKCNTVEELKSHLLGLCSLRGADDTMNKLINSVECTRLINLCIKS